MKDQGLLSLVPVFAGPRFHSSTIACRFLNMFVARLGFTELRASMSLCLS